MLCLLTASALGALTQQAERNVQVASISAAYGFSALHTVVWLEAAFRKRRMHRDWVAGTWLSAISVAGLAAGSTTLAIGFSRDTRDALTIGMASIPGYTLGIMHLAVGIDSARKGEGRFWARPGPAAVTLVQGVTFAGFGTVLAVGANPGRSNLSKLPPLYTWAGTGAILTGYAVGSLIHQAGRKRRRRRAAASPIVEPAAPWESGQRLR